MKTWKSLPNLNFSTEKEGKTKPVGHFHFRPRAKVSVPHIRYKGRYSWNRTNRGKSDLSCERDRTPPGRSRAVNNARPYSYFLDENSLSYESIPSMPISAKEFALSLVPAATTSALEDSDFALNVPNRSTFYNKLYQLSIANFSIASQSVLAEPTSLNNGQEHQKEIYLMTLKDEKHKMGDLLWLAFQAVLAGRPMLKWKEQLQSLRIQDTYIMEHRRKEICILNEISTFCFVDKDQRVYLEGHLAPLKENRPDSMKWKLRKVRVLLDKLDSFESLFPSSKYMVKLVNFDEKLRNRIDLLNMWYKTTMNLYDTIREVGRILGVNDVRHRPSSSISTSTSELEVLTPSPLSWPSLEGPFKEDPNRNNQKFDMVSAFNINNSNAVEFGTSDLPALLGQPPRQYADFVSRSLKLKGMHRVLERLENVSSAAISKAAILLEKPPGVCAETTHTVNFESKRYLPITADYFSSKVLDGLGRYREREGGQKYPVHHEEFIAMGLPSFINLFHYLVRVPVDLVDEWLKMRGNMQLNGDLLTLQTIIEDCHDCLRAAVSVKHTYVTLVQLVDLDNQKILENLTGFERHLSDLFKNYLTCVRHWALAELSTSAYAHWGDRFLTELKKEWKLARSFAVNIICGEDEVAQRFCFIGKDLLQRMVKNYFSYATDVLDERRSDFEALNERTVPSQIHVACRHFRELVKELRSRSLRALSFARSLISNLEKCALYAIKSTVPELLYQLYVKAHALVVLSRKHHHFIIFCDENAAADSTEFVEVLLNITGGRSRQELPSHIAKRSGYLLIFSPKSLGKFSSKAWRGKRVSVNVDADTEMFLHFLQFHSDACLVALNGMQLASAREQVEKAMKVGSRSLLNVVEEHFCCHDGIAEAVSQLKEEAVDAYREIWRGLVEGMVDEILDKRTLESLDVKELNTMRDTLLQAYWLTFEYRREIYAILPRSMRKHFAVETVSWIEHWSSFVIRFRGDGAKHWATRSLKFLTFAAHPQLTSLLSDKQYEDLVRIIKQCLERTISRNSRGSSSSQDMSSGREESIQDFKRRAASLGDAQMIFEAPARLDRIREAVKGIDQKRDHLLREQERIGHVKHMVRTDLSLKSLCGMKKQAPFEWRRTDNKIGKGKFGTVYIVLTLTEPSVMAMKQISIDGNHTVLRALIDEVENLRKLDHENIVKYYATEVHPEELLIFMEYCPGGTLQSKCFESIEMPRVRWYTCCILKAVEYIHDRLIVHRDIKPGNIFIGRGNVLKLGDFGSSVRLRGEMTAFGEIVQWAGTPAYMAPEVQTLGGKVRRNNEEELYGYGRAADIWSLGCVVLEMCTGKPPWHELHTLQIVFCVGNGKRPAIPPKLQADNDCMAFLDLCFNVDPALRATAKALRQHPFANVVKNPYE